VLEPEAPVLTASVLPEGVAVGVAVEALPVVAAEHPVITHPKTTASAAAVQRLDISAFRVRVVRTLPLHSKPRMRRRKKRRYARIVTSGERRPAARASVATYWRAASLVLKTPPGMTLR
jgi:hypothetical protein